MKLGQLLATRVDLFPPDWIAEFERLQSDVPPVPFETLLPALEQALGRSPFEVFRELDRTPLGAASIAQVHGAILQDGTRGGRQDARGLGSAPRSMPTCASWPTWPGCWRARFPEARRYQPVADGRRVRALHAARARPRAGGARPGALRPQLRGRPGVLVPRIYWEYTRESMNVQERVQGIPGHDLAAVDAAGLDRAPWPGAAPTRCSR